MDGINISSASNTVSGAVPGLTFNLLSADPGVDVSLGVAPDTTQAASAINQFVTDYNKVIADLNSQFTFSGTSEGVLSTDSTIRNLQSEVLGALSYTYTPASGTTTVPNLSSLGISVNNDGTLTVDSSTLQSTLQNNFSDVQTFFQGTTLNGFANSLDQQLTSFISPSDGAFTVDLQSINNQIHRSADRYHQLSDQLHSAAANPVAERVFASGNPVATAAERDETDQRRTRPELVIQRLTGDDNDTDRSGI